MPRKSLAVAVLLFAGLSARVPAAVAQGHGSKAAVTSGTMGASPRRDNANRVGGGHGLTNEFAKESGGGGGAGAGDAAMLAAMAEMMKAMNEMMVTMREMMAMLKEQNAAAGGGGSAAAAADAGGESRKAAASAPSRKRDTADRKPETVAPARKQKLNKDSGE